MFFNIAGSIWPYWALFAIVTILVLLGALNIVQTRLKREERAHKKTEKVLQTAKALLRLLFVAATPGSSRMHDYYKEFLKLVPSGKPGDVGLEYPHAEIERIRHKCEASALLCDLRTLRQYTVPDTAPSSEEAVVEIRRTLGVKVHESLARVAEQIIEKLNRALSNGRWSYADIGTGNQEVCMMVAAIVRYSGTETLGERSTYETHVTFLKDTVSNLSLTFGVDFRPILATALAQKSPAKEGESGALTEAQA